VAGTASVPLAGSVIVVDRQHLALDLKTYGEEELAQRVLGVSDEQLRRIGERASEHAYTGMLIAKALVLATIEVVEGSPRPPRLSRRKLKGIYPEHEKAEAEPLKSPYRTSKELEQAILGALSEGLSGYGFRKRMRGIFTKELSPETLGWFGIPAGLDRRMVYVDMYVNVGVRHQPTEHLVAELSGSKFHPYAPPTYGLSIDSLRPRRGELGWKFSNEIDNEAVLQDMVSAIRDYALPFLASYTTATSIAAAIERKSYPLPPVGDLIWIYRLPVLLLLTGSPNKAREAVDRILKSIETRHLPADDHFRGFAAKLLERLP